MKKIKITMRDVFFFLLGVISIIVIDVIISWPDARDSFNKGYEDARIDYSTEQTK